MYSNREAQIRYRVINRCLKEKRQAGAAELATACSEAMDGKPVEISTVESDLIGMRNDAGLGYFAPVVKDPESGKYRYSDPDYSIENIPLKPDEVENLSSAASLLNQLSSRGMFVELGGVIHKLIDAANINSMDFTRRIPDFIKFEKTPSYTGSQFLGKIIEAIASKKVLKIFYKPYEEDKPYFTFVHPYLLKEYRFRWYLVGLNDQRKLLRTYALDRIWEIEETRQEYTPAAFSVKDYFKHAVGVIVPHGEPQEILLQVRKPQAQYMISQPLHESQLIHEETSEHIVFAFTVFATWEFKSMIRGLGSEARILSPEDLKNDMIGELQATLANYAALE